MGLQEAATVVMVGAGAAVMVMVAEPDFVVSSVLVAATVTGFLLGTALGAV